LLNFKQSISCSFLPDYVLKDLNVLTICEAIVVFKEKTMKKTSLLLAMGALLYGTANVYAADPLDIDPEMTDDEIVQVIEGMGEIVPPDGPEVAENEADPPLPPGTDPPDGLDPAGALFLNVGLNNDNIVHKPMMCDPSFQVDGGAMAKFPVTVNGGPRVWWKQVTNTKGKAYYVAVGKGWILVQDGDTWYKANPWRLYSNIPISSILLEPLERITKWDPPGEKRVYAFDVGGKQHDGTFDEHTIGAARGQFIIRSTSSPTVAFTAIYSNPVFVDHNPNPPDPIDIDINDPPSENNNNRVPTHDLYGTLEINFTTPVQGGLSFKDLAFAFVADTDCIQLPVVQAVVSSNLLTLYGEGLVYVSANGSPLQGFPAFEVMKDGVNTFDVSDVIAKLKAGSCYSLVNESSLGTNIPLEIDGVDMPNGEACL
jgi:hypothetical protein